MNDEPIELQRSKDLPPNETRWWIWILIGLAPIPIGLLIGPLNIFNSSRSHDKVLFLFYVVIAGGCSLLCGVGQTGGFKARTTSNILAGVVAGVVIGLFNVFVVFFAGCCTGLSHIN